MCFYHSENSWSKRLTYFHFSEISKRIYILQAVVCHYIYLLRCHTDSKWLVTWEVEAARWSNFLMAISEKYKKLIDSFSEN